MLLVPFIYLLVLCANDGSLMCDYPCAKACAKSKMYGP